MKIEVLRCDGRSEILNIVGHVDFSEPYEEHGEPVGQGCIYAPELGMRYFFRADGRYDGWEAELGKEGVPVTVPQQEEMQATGKLPQSLRDFIAEIEKGRDIREREEKG